MLINTLIELIIHVE